MDDMNNNNPYLNPIDDGLPMRESGEWAAQKLDYLYRYLDIFTTSMHKKELKGIHYIDLFSGPGKCKNRDTGQIYLGSPLLALTVRFPFSQYFFVDSDEIMIDTLKTRCDTSGMASKIKYIMGDSNQVVTKIVSEINAIDQQFISGKSHSLNLAFLDPEGFELEWSTVALLGNMKRMDLIINYPQGGLNRDMPNEIDKPSPSKIDGYFGGMEWRQIYENFRKKETLHLHRELIDLYKGKLESLGYIEVKENENEPLMRNTKRNAPLYRLIFASKHTLGEQFWSKINKRDLHGQGKLF